MVRKELAIKAMEEYASQYQHPVPDASNNYEWQNEFYANIGYDYAEHIPEIKDSVELFQNYIDKGMFAASQPAAGYSLQQVADAFEAGAENEYEKHFGAIPPLSLNKETYLASLQPAGNEAVTYTQEQIITALMQCGYSIVDRQEILQSL